MNNALAATARTMVAPGKGILAADESTGSIGKKFTKAGLASTEEMRRSYRDMLLTAPGLGEHISGVILFDETMRQQALDGRPFLAVLAEAGVLPGIKVDQGLKEMEVSPEERVTNGLEGLPARLSEYAAMGARFAKWRAVITIGQNLPTEANIRQNAKDLAAYARACQDAGLVPIVEPEVLMDGPHSTHGIKRCAEVTKAVLTAVFEELRHAGIAIEGMILKPSMVLPGKESGITASPEEIAAATIAVLAGVLPDNLPGVAFLSGGQSEREATANLNALNTTGTHPWPLTFSYGRALEDSAFGAWAGKRENKIAAQRIFLHRAHMNSLAALGAYAQEQESKN